MATGQSYLYEGQFMYLDEFRARFIPKAEKRRENMSLATRSRIVEMFTQVLN